MKIVKSQQFDELKIYVIIIDTFVLYSNNIITDYKMKKYVYFDPQTVLCFLSYKTILHTIVHNY